MASGLRSRPPPEASSLTTMDPRKVSELRAFVKMCRQDPSVLHTEEMRFLREWVESMGVKYHLLLIELSQKKILRKKKETR